jgi:anti-sigma factor RsiW
MTHSAIRDGGRLHDYVDGLLSGAERAAVEAHVGACDDCRAEVRRLLALRARIAALPRAVEPSRDLWTDVRARLVRHPAREEVAPAHTRATLRPLAAWRGAAPRRHARLAAAAIALVVVSSAITATLVRRGESTAGSVATGPAAPPASPRAAASPGGAGYAAYAGYERAASDLAATLEARRSALAPETVAKVEASLRVIDSAIAEARAALARDPGNQALVELLGVSYRQKLDVLHRAAELSTEI